MFEQRTRALSRLKSRAFVLWSIVLVTIAFSPPVRALGARSKSVSSDVEQSKALSREAQVVKTACDLIYDGRFDDARAVVETAMSQGQNSAQLKALESVLAEKAEIEKRREQSRKEVYQEQLDRLKEIETGDYDDPNEALDINDVNDMVEALTTISKAAEYADGQRDELLESPFVRTMFRKAIDAASEFEMQGKWLEAYTHSYYWLTAIDPNNEGYEEYSDELVTKAGIVAAFQDSPCESSEERFEGIKPLMFLKAINFLNLYYVSVIDYGEMAEAGIERCVLLADVLARAPQFREALPPDPNDPNSEDSQKFVPPPVDKLEAWAASLKSLLNEVKRAPTGYGMKDFMGTFDKVLKTNDDTAELSESILIAQFAEAALETLDPYTVMVWPKSVEDFQKIMMNEFTGIGVEISKRKGLLTVSSLLPGTPAYKSGLDAGDVISKVNGIETKDMTLMCAVKKITGPKGTEVTLTISRPGEEDSREITIVRDKIVIPTIRGWQRSKKGEWFNMVDKESKIGYIRLTSFSEDSAKDFEKTLNDLESAGMKALVLDLRENSGGLLDTAVKICDMFIDGGLIVKTQPGFGRVGDWKTAKKSGTHPDYPMVVLINSRSASASEIVAGALGDKKYERAILVGDRTHGKGSVQGITHYPGENAQLKYTMAYYHLPSDQRVKSREEMQKLGRSDWGVGPDVEVKLRSEELKKMIEVQRENEVLFQADHDDSNGDVHKHVIEETLEVDPQLAVGILVARAKLIEAGKLPQSN